jgi:anti-sigma B factor antagonist
VGPSRSVSGPVVSMRTSMQVVLDPPRARLSLRGEFDLLCRDDLRRQLLDAEDLGCREVLVDASAVTFVDCASLGTIVAAQERLAREGGKLVVVRASYWFERVCRLAGYAELLGESPATTTASDVEPQPPVAAGG